MPPTPLPAPDAAEVSQNGWVKSVDPSTGRTFYANRNTRATQWDPPAGWREPSSSGNGQSSSDDLPDEWEEMTDPTSGRKFYVDHVRKITTWDRPVARSKPNDSPAYVSTENHEAKRNSQSYKDWIAQEEAAAIAAGYEFNTDVNNGFEENSIAQQGGSVNNTLATSATPDFVVRTIGDKERIVCPQCLEPFTFASKRRHHCRLCGDVFCDACSSNRVALPLDGPEFQNPVRVCDLCNKDIERGNYFSMRRYLPPLQLHVPGSPNPPSSGEVAGSATHVVAALGALSTDLDSILQDSSSFEEKITIPANVLVPAICRHIDRSITQEHAVRALSTLLTIGSLVGTDTFVRAVYSCHVEAEDNSKKSVIESILKLLEKSSSTQLVLSAQVQAARVLFYLTDPKILSKLLNSEKPDQNREPTESNSDLLSINQDDANRTSNDTVLVEDIIGSNIENNLDVHRALRNVLDHCSASGTPALQRWATASIRHLVIEDKRRSIASNSYASFIPQISSTGGILILCSLMGAGDPDTRTHATAALASIVISARAVDQHRKTESKKRLDKFLIKSIVDANGCGSSLSKLVLSSDDTVARMGCSFATSLVSPLLIPVIIRNNIVTEDISAYHDAALSLVNDGPCLSAFLQIIKPNTLKTRSTELVRLAIETLAAIGVACCSFSNDVFRNSKIEAAVSKLETEDVGESALNLLKSSQYISIRDSPSVQLREAAGIFLCTLSYCTRNCAEFLLSKRAITILLSAAADSNMQRPSQKRNEKALKCLPLLEAVYALMKHAIGSTVNPLDQLLEALEGGIIPLLSRFMLARIEFDTERSVGDISLKVVSCLITDTIFSAAFYDQTHIGGTRLYKAILADAESEPRGGANLISTTISLLHAVTIHIQQKGHDIDWFQSAENDNHSALLKLEEACLLAVGSVCGAVSSSVIQNHDDSVDNNKGPNDFVLAPNSFIENKRDACIATCGILFDVIESNFFATLLVGALGERIVSPTLRFLTSLCGNGPEDVHLKIAKCGVLIPVSDLLRNAMNSGDRFTIFASLYLFTHCGVHVTADMGEGNNLLSCVRDVIRVAATVIKDDQDEDPLLKSEILVMIEALSGNASLWSAIASEALPSLTIFLRLNTDYLHSRTRCQSVMSILRIIQGIIPLPSNASACDRCGIISAIADLMKSESKKDNEIIDEAYHLQLIGLGVLRIFTGFVDIRRGDGIDTFGVVNSGVLSATCSALTASTFAPNCPFAGPITHMGIEILLEILSDLNDDSDMTDLQKIKLASSIVDCTSTYSSFIKTLVSTILSEPSSIDDSVNVENLSHSNGYGNALVCPDRQCAGYSSTRQAVIVSLTAIAAQCSLSEQSKSCERFWNSFLLEDEVSTTSSVKANIAAACAFMLDIISQEEKAFDKGLPCVANKNYLQNKLISALKDCLETIPNDSSSRSLLLRYRVPEQCVILSKSSVLSVKKSAFDLIDLIAVRFPELLTSLVSNQQSLTTVFDMLSDGKSGVQFSRILFGMAQDNTLGKVVRENDLRQHAIGTLTKGCTLDEDPSLEQLRIASCNIGCLISIFQRDDNNDRPSSSPDDIVMQKNEAKALAVSLAPVISYLISARIENGSDALKDSRLVTSDETEADPEIILLCALATHDDAVPALCENGAIPALIAVAGYGNLPALNALCEAARSSPDLVIEFDGHIAAKRVLTEYDDISDEVKLSCLSILTDICSGSRSRRSIVGKCSKLCLSGCMTFLSYQGDDDQGDTEACSDNNLGTSSTGESHLSSSLQLAVFNLLNEMVLVRGCRDLILNSPSIINSTLKLTSNSSDEAFEFATLVFLTRVAPFLCKSDALITTEHFVSVLAKGNNIFGINERNKRKQAVPGTTTISQNLILSIVVDGLEILMGTIESIDEVVGILLEMCLKRIETFSSSASYLNFSVIKDCGDFFRGCTSFFLLLLGNELSKDLATIPQIFKMLLRIVMLKPQDVPVEGNRKMWSCARVQSLQCLVNMTRSRFDGERDSSFWQQLVSEFEGEIKSSKATSKKNMFLRDQNSTSKSYAVLDCLDDIIHDNSSDNLACTNASKLVHYFCSE